MISPFSGPNLRSITMNVLQNASTMFVISTKDLVRKTDRLAMFAGVMILIYSSNVLLCCVDVSVAHCIYQG